ncbi:uncharacterized protein LOC133743111 [Rosa rugosa]|uniref:uncharacterized protein LOC133743111 n=1 Tax=Rosa rugosa TaxID=74645 RepID=UPI002B40DF59|nr:uncharacterized protein LOC133743111 [Rosa rugosa]
MLMTKLSMYSHKGLTTPPHPSPAVPIIPRPIPTSVRTTTEQSRIRRAAAVFAAKSGGGFSLNSILKRCETCEGKGAIDCQGCKGTGRNKKHGNIFERWKCFDCQGFGMKGCPSCGKGGLTPEQRSRRKIKEFD